MRIRTVKPEFWTSESNAKLSRDARLCFLALLNFADDSGRSRGHVAIICGALFPFDTDAPKLLPGWLDELERENKIRRYVVGDTAYLEICNFLKHQKIEKPTPSRLPSFDEGSPTPHRALPDSSGVVSSSLEVVSVPVSSTATAAAAASNSDLGEAPQPEPPPPIRANTPALEFFVWVQGRREAAGLVREKPVRSEAISSFYSEALMELNGDVEALKAAVYRWGEDKYWQKQNPPLPFRAFMAEWRKYAPVRATATT